MVGLRTLATVCYAPGPCYFTLPSEIRDLNAESGSLQVWFVPAVLTTSESEASLPYVVLALRLCGYCCTDLWALLCLVHLHFGCYRMTVSVGAAWLHCRILTSNGAAFGSTEFICGPLSLLNNSYF